MDSKDIYKSLGLQIKKYRESHGESQADLGRILRVGSSAVSKYESGTAKLDIPTLIAINRHYGCDILAPIYATANMSSLSPKTLDRLVKLNNFVVREFSLE